MNIWIAQIISRISSNYPWVNGGFLLSLSFDIFAWRAARSASMPRNRRVLSFAELAWNASGSDCFALCFSTPTLWITTIVLYTCLIRATCEVAVFNSYLPLCSIIFWQSCLTTRSAAPNSTLKPTNPLVTGWSRWNGFNDRELGVTRNCNGGLGSWLGWPVSFLEAKHWKKILPRKRRDFPSKPQETYFRLVSSIWTQKVPFKSSTLWSWFSREDTSFAIYHCPHFWSHQTVIAVRFTCSENRIAMDPVGSDKVDHADQCTPFMARQFSKV